MAGLACAEGLIRNGHEVVLLDKGRGPGGRMSTRRLNTVAGEAHFDHGAQYFTIRDQRFGARAGAWIADGAVAPWPSAGSEAFVGVPAMNAPVRQMADGVTAHWARQVTQVERSGQGWRLRVELGGVFEVDVIVFAMPAEQTSAMLASAAPDLAARASAARSEPCWTVMLAFAEAVAVDQNCWRGKDSVGWAARNSSKPGRIGPESWVVQAAPDWSAQHLDADPDWIAVALKASFSELLDTELPPCVGLASHRWRYARSGVGGSRAIFDSDRRLGICGDWLIAPRVEAAWISGTELAELIGV